MICGSCKSDNPAHARFCIRCGTGLAFFCVGCGQPVPQGAAFCPACGAAQSPGAEISRPSSTPEPQPASDWEGDRRNATILFSDLSGFTALGERLDPEVVRDVVDRIKHEAVRIVETHGGVVNQFIGDEVMALFGIPASHEDDPSRAVRAAMELNTRMGELSAELKSLLGQPIILHSGIHSGLVVTGSQDGRDGMYGVTGDTVNTTARLVALAKPGEVLVSHETQMRIAPFFETEALEPVQVKGKTQPIRPYRILQKTSLQTRLDISEQRGFTPFTGRRTELAQLEQRLAELQSGRGALITIAGEAGVGKSRLFFEFQRQMFEKGVTVLHAHCQITGTGTPFAPIAEALRGLWLEHLKGSDGPQKIKQAVLTVDPALERYLPQYFHLLSLRHPDHPLPDTLKSEELRRTLQLGVSALLVQLARKNPVALMLEDLHWADEGSVLLTRYLAGMISDVPLLVLINYRPEYTGEWGSLGHHQHVVLTPLDRETTGIILKHVLGVERLPEGLSERFHEHTAGNPFFIEEMARTLVEEGSVEIRSVKEAVLSRALDTIVMPDTVQAVVRSRLDRLSEDTKRVLYLAAVVGQEFSEAILDHMLGGPGRAFKALEILKSLGLVYQVRLMPSPVFSFKHKITQEVAYETLLLQQRRKMHLRVAQAVEALESDRQEEHAELLAGHYDHAEVWDKAAHHYLVSANRAKAHFGYAAALRLCQSALAAGARMDNSASLRLAGHELKGDLLSLTAELATSNAEYEKAKGLASDTISVRRITNKIHHRYRLKVEGGEMTCFVHGTGEKTLILYQAVPYGLESFQNAVEVLCQDFRMVTYFPLGTGDSDPIPTDYSVEMELANAAHVAETFGEGEVTGIGISKGGRMVMKLALTQPHLFDRIISVNGGFEKFGPGMKFPPDFSLPIWKEAIKAKELFLAGKISSFERMDSFMRLIMNDPGLEEIVRNRQRLLRNMPAETLTFFLDPSKGIFIDINELGTISIPALFVGSTNDLMFPAAGGRYLASNTPRSQFFLFEGVGHLPNLAALGRFCAVVKEFALTGNVTGAERLCG